MSHNIDLTEKDYVFPEQENNRQENNFFQSLSSHACYLTNGYTFEENIAKFVSLYGMEIFTTAESKLSFQASFTYRGEEYNLYDWKSSHTINIGTSGKGKKCVDAFIVELNKLLVSTNPSEFEVMAKYDPCYVYSYPARPIRYF
jgi:hypothetical protein